MSWEVTTIVSPPFILEGSTIFAALSKQLDDLGDGGSKEGETNCEEKHLKSESCRSEILFAVLFSCLECATKGGHAVDVSVADGGHGHHEKVDAVPVGKDLAVVKVWRVTRVFQEVNCKLIGWYLVYFDTNFFLPIPAAASHTEMNIAMSWVSLKVFL